MTELCIQEENWGFGEVAGESDSASESLETGMSSLIEIHYMRLFG